MGTVPIQNFPLFCMQYRTAMSLAAGLLARLDRRQADGKEGLGYVTGSPALPAARAALKESLVGTDGHYEHIAPEVGGFAQNSPTYILLSSCC